VWATCCGRGRAVLSSAKSSNSRKIRVSPHADGLVRKAAGRARGHVIKDDRQVRRIRDGAENGNKALPGSAYCSMARPTGSHPRRRLAHFLQARLRCFAGFRRLWDSYPKFAHSIPRRPLKINSRQRPAISTLRISFRRAVARGTRARSMIRKVWKPVFPTGSRSANDRILRRASVADSRTPLWLTPLCRLYEARRGFVSNSYAFGSRFG
jgi:hypothetical protein